MQNRRDKKGVALDDMKTGKGGPPMTRDETTQRMPKKMRKGGNIRRDQS